VGGHPGVPVAKLTATPERKNGWELRNKEPALVAVNRERGDGLRKLMSECKSSTLPGHQWLASHHKLTVFEINLVAQGEESQRPRHSTAQMTQSNAYVKMAPEKAPFEKCFGFVLNWS
jgi:hypothetical protein